MLKFSAVIYLFSSGFIAGCLSRDVEILIWFDVLDILIMNVHRKSRMRKGDTRDEWIAGVWA